MSKENILSKNTLYIYIYIYIYACIIKRTKNMWIYMYIRLYIRMLITTIEIILALSDDCVATWYTCTPLYLNLNLNVNHDTLSVCVCVCVWKKQYIQSMHLS